MMNFPPFPPLKLPVRIVLTHISKASPEPALSSEVSVAFLLSVGEHRPALDSPMAKGCHIKALHPLCLESAGWSGNLDQRQNTLLFSSDPVLTCCNP